MSETPQEIVDRVFRENRRYTGDGLPGEPQNAPIPVGDPASGAHNPKKADMRAALLAPISAAAQSASEAEADANRAEAAAQSVVARAWFKTVANLLADNNTVIGYAGSGAQFEVQAGDIIEAQGFRYEVVAEDATDYDRETAGLVRLKVPDDIPEAFIEMFGEASDENAVLRAMRTKKLQQLVGTGNTVTIYCEPVGGNDTALGASDSPLATVQEAVDRIPKQLSNCAVVIDLATAATLPATYDEDVVAERIVCRSTGGAVTTGRWSIVGDWTSESVSTPSNVKIGSLAIVSCYGLVGPRVLGVRMMRTAPIPADVNENAAIQIINSSEASLWDIEFDDNAIDVGVIAYNSHADARRLNANNIKQVIVHAKRHSSVNCVDFTGTFAPATPASFIGGFPFGANENSKITYNGDELSLGPNATGWGARHRYGGRFAHVTSAGARVWTDEFKWSGVVISGYQSSNYDITAGSYTRATFNTDLSNNAGRFGSNRVFFRNDMNGLWKLHAQLEILKSTVADGSTIELRIQDGEGTIKRRKYISVPAGGSPSFTVEIDCVVDLTAAANSNQLTYECVIWFSGSGTRTIVGGIDKTVFEAHRLG